MLKMHVYVDIRYAMTAVLAMVPASMSRNRPCQSFLNHF